MGSKFLKRKAVAHGVKIISHCMQFIPRVAILQAVCCVLGEKGGSGWDSRKVIMTLRNKVLTYLRVTQTRSPAISSKTAGAHGRVNIATVFATI